MTTGMESGQSVSTTAYYKGFSMLVTKRDQSVDLMPLVEDQMALIDQLIDKGCQPSWNTETNKTALGDVKRVNTTPIVEQPKEINYATTCMTCKAPATQRSGTSRTTGKDWNAVFCSTEDKSHTKWL
jgi:hypothetical protein